MTDYQIIDSIWFGDIGIVRIRPEVGEDKFYIGQGGGLSQSEDEQTIAAWGMPYYPEVINEFCNVHK